MYVHLSSASLKGEPFPPLFLPGCSSGFRGLPGITYLAHYLDTDILRIENLWQFKNLRKLQLDNNIIEDVYGLEMLTQLEWLDLSFNNIEVIRGLSKLVCLKDLSLANNRIQCIENMDSLRESLQVLSLANNLIEDRDHVSFSS